MKLKIRKIEAPGNPAFALPGTWAAWHMVPGHCHARGEELYDFIYIQGALPFPEWQCYDSYDEAISDVRRTIERRS